MVNLQSGNKLMMTFVVGGKSEDMTEIPETLVEIAKIDESKDTVFVGADETVRIIVQFKNKGIFMYHCHILEHEEAGMMGQLKVE